MSFKKQIREWNEMEPAKITKPSDSQMSSLLPCPWCGEIPNFHQSYGKYFLLHSCEVIKLTLGKRRKKELTEKWNTRQR